MDKDIERARAALTNLIDRPERRTVHAVIKQLLPEIETALSERVPTERVIEAVGLALRKPIPKATFSATLCRVRKEVAGTKGTEPAPTDGIAGKVRRRVKAAINGK